MNDAQSFPRHVEQRPAAGVVASLGLTAHPGPLHEPEIKRTASPLTPALSPLRGEGDETRRLTGSKREFASGNSLLVERRGRRICDSSAFSLSPHGERAG